ncbi:hypothetical protein DSM25558_4520 [Agrobacterium sp. DSM 25558]|nr:hypothetical protein DSM25558_4520 [Agrobacterium sp. DSM 25558]
MRATFSQAPSFEVRLTFRAKLGEFCYGLSGK